MSIIYSILAGIGLLTVIVVIFAAVAMYSGLLKIITQDQFDDKDEE